MKIHKLSAEKRDVLGKKVKKLRAQGSIPANIYGKSVKSQSIQVKNSDFETLYAEVGETGLVEITVAGAKEPHHVLIHNVQMHPVKGGFVHIDFHEVALKEKIKVAVPITLTGESPVARQKLGVLLQTLNEVEVEALPTDLPEEIPINISTLTAIGHEVKVGDIKATNAFTIITDPTRVIVKINPLEKEEAPAPAIAAPAEGETAATETPADGAAPTKLAEEKAAPAKEEKKKE